MKKRYWHIEGYNGLKKIYDRKVRFGYFSENQIQNLLKTLSAKAGDHNLDEIVGAYEKKKTKIANELLSIQKNGTYPVYSCGSNPHFITRVIVDE